MNRKGFTLFIFLLLFSFSSALFTQETTEDKDSSSEPVLEEDSEEPDELSLFDRTLRKDIETASYYELVAWVDSLGLENQGSIDSLRKNLYSYYQIPENPEEVSTSGGSLITIKSASDTDYFTIEEPDHQMIRLKGNVLVEMEEEERNRSHIIQADEIIFNQTENTLTATGNLEYRMISGDYEDLFYGDSLTFSLSSWNGVIFKGSSLRTETIEGEERTFYFNGEVIRRAGSGGVFILEDGDVQTQDVKNPDFHLKSQRLWLMGPKEWGVRHGILYMGHVPVLYIPFYYKPGNEMIFNPVIGSRLREGNFIQTTTYLLGRKDSSENLAFFQLGDSDESNYKLVREGLYLMKENEPPDEDNDDTLKVMADWYSRLGYFTGIEGEFSDKELFSSLNFSTGLGVSRTISDSNTIYFEDESGEFRSDWNSIVWGEDELPFRWGQSLMFQSVHLTGTFLFYSDPYFNRDFMNREESFDWLNTLLTTNEETDKEEIPQVTDMEWDLTYSNTISTDFFSPYLENVSLNELRFRMDWNRKSNESESLQYANDPAREFFFPETVDLPYFRASLSGKPISFSTLDGWGWDSEREETADEESEENLLIDPPWAVSDPEEEEENQDESMELIQKEPLWNRSFSDYSPEYYRGSLSYDYSTLMYIQGETDHNEWSSPDDMDFVMDETIYKSNNSFTTTLSNDFFDETFGVNNTNAIQFNYKSHLDALGAVTDNMVYEDYLSDYQYQSLNWDNQFEVEFNPFLGSPSFSSSKVGYELDNMLYEKVLDSYEEGGDPVFSEEWADWDEEKINKHFMEGSLKYSPGIFSATSSAKYDLPPLLRKDIYTNTVGIRTDHWDLSGSHSFTYAEDELGEREWTKNPLILSAAWTPLEDMDLEQELTYDFEEETYTKSRSYLSVWGLYAEYLHEYTTVYEWDPEELDWTELEEDFVPSSFSTGYDWKFGQKELWKNRIFWDTDLTLDWTRDLQKYTKNELSFIWNYHLNIFQFLDLEYAMTTVNQNMYLYSEDYRDRLGIDGEYSFWEDLSRSFNIFSPDQQDRYDSFFNLKNISLDLIHHLREWDLTLSYEGWPELEENRYEWQSKVSIFLKWNPIPQIQADILYSEEEWSVDTEKD